MSELPADYPNRWNEAINADYPDSNRATLIMLDGIHGQLAVVAELLRLLVQQGRGENVDQHVEAIAHDGATALLAASTPPGPWKALEELLGDFDSDALGIDTDATPEQCYEDAARRLRRALSLPKLAGGGS